MTAQMLWYLSRGHRKGFAMGIGALLGVDLLGLFPPRSPGLMVESVQGKSSPYSPLLVVFFYVGAGIKQDYPFGIILSNVIGFR